MPADLPLFGADPQLSERADAARNRQRILAAAERLVAERGIEVAQATWPGPMTTLTEDYRIPAPSPEPDPDPGFALA